MSNARADRLWKLQHRYAPYLFVAPFVVLFAAFMLYPLVRSFVLSFYKAAGVRHEEFVGLDNFRFILTDRIFWGALANTVLYTVLFLIVWIPAALGLAVLLNNPSVRWRSAWRFAFFSTHLVGGVFAAVLFAMVLSPREGLLNRLLGVEINWLGNPDLVLPAILIAAWWISIGFGMIYFLAALQAVDRELYEAAEVDGATPWQKFWQVTVPGIRPMLVFMLIVGTIMSFQLFELPWVLFQSSAGPGSRGLTIVMFLYQQGFETGDLGYAAAIGWALVLILSFVAAAQIRITRAAREED